MPDVPDHPIAYTALQPGTSVQTSDGHHFATVQAVLVDEKVSVFDGIVVHTEEGARFVDADQVASISTTRVLTTLSREQAANLPPPDGSNVIDIKPPRSMADRLGRMFGRRKL
jgi:sporulation protein YlmC with PRC-barrel domain